MADPVLQETRCLGIGLGVGEAELHELPGDLLLQLLGGPLRNNLTTVDEDDAVGKLVGFLEVLRGEQDRRPVRDELLDDGLRDRPRRGPKPGLSIDAIVDAAVRVADAEGLAAVSMSRVVAARRCGGWSDAGRLCGDDDAAHRGG